MNLNKLKKLFFFECYFYLRNWRILMMIISAFVIIPFIVINSFQEYLILSENSFFLKPFAFIFFLLFTNILPITVGIHTLNWESSYISLLFTVPKFYYNLIQIRFYSVIFLLIINTIYLTLLLYLFVSSNRLLELSITSLLFNSGLVIPFVLFLIKNNNQYIDLFKISFVNYDITTFNSVLAPLIISAFSYLLYIVIYKITNSEILVYSIFSLIGLIGLSLNQFILKKISTMVKAVRHTIINNFS